MLCKTTVHGATRGPDILPGYLSCVPGWTGLGLQNGWIWCTGRFGGWTGTLCTLIRKECATKIPKGSSFTCLQCTRRVLRKTCYAGAEFNWQILHKNLAGCDQTSLWENSLNHKIHKLVAVLTKSVTYCSLIVETFAQQNLHLLQILLKSDSMYKILNKWPQKIVWATTAVPATFRHSSCISFVML